MREQCSSARLLRASRFAPCLGVVWATGELSAQYEQVDPSTQAALMERLVIRGADVEAALDGCRVRAKWTYETPVEYSSSVAVAAGNLAVWTSGESLLELRGGTWLFTASERILGVGAAIEMRAMEHMGQFVFPRTQIGGRVGVYAIVDADTARGLPAQRRVLNPHPALAVGLVGPTSYGCFSTYWRALPAAMGTVHAVLQCNEDPASSGSRSAITTIVKFDWVAPYAGLGLNDPELYFTSDLKFRGYSYRNRGAQNPTRNVFHVTDWTQVGTMPIPCKGLLFRTSSDLPDGHELAAVSKFEITFEERAADPMTHWPKWRPGDVITDHRISRGATMSSEADPATYRYSARPEQILAQAASYARVHPPADSAGRSWLPAVLVFGLAYWTTLKTVTRSGVRYGTPHMTGVP